MSGGDRHTRFAMLRVLGLRVLSGRAADRKRSPRSTRRDVILIVPGGPPDGRGTPTLPAHPIMTPPRPGCPPYQLYNVTLAVAMVVVVGPSSSSFLSTRWPVRWSPNDAFPPIAGTLPTTGLALALGPFVEHISMLRGTLFSRTLSQPRSVLSSTDRRIVAARIALSAAWQEGCAGGGKRLRRPKLYSWPARRDAAVQQDKDNH